MAAALACPSTYKDTSSEAEWDTPGEIGRTYGEKSSIQPLSAPHPNPSSRARVEHDRVLRQIITDSVADHAELYKQNEGDPSFKQWLGDRIFGATYQPPEAE